MEYGLVIKLSVIDTTIRKEKCKTEDIKRLDSWVYRIGESSVYLGLDISLLIDWIYQQRTKGPLSIRDFFTTYQKSISQEKVNELFYELILEGIDLDSKLNNVWI